MTIQLTPCTRSHEHVRFREVLDECARGTEEARLGRRRLLRRPRRVQGAAGPGGSGLPQAMVQTCLIHLGRGWRFQSDAVAEPVQSLHGVPTSSLSATFDEHVGSWVEVGLAGVQVAVGRDQDLMPDGNHGPSVASSPAKLHVALPKIDALGPGLGRFAPGLRATTWIPSWSSQSLACLPSHAARDTCGAHDVRCPGVGNTLMSVPVSARIVCADRVSTPGIVASSCTCSGRSRLPLPAAALGPERAVARSIDFLSERRLTGLITLPCSGGILVLAERNGLIWPVLLRVLRRLRVQCPLAQPRPPRVRCGSVDHDEVSYTDGR